MTLIKRRLLSTGSFFFVLAPLLLKAVYVENFIVDYTGQHSIGFLQAIANDSPFYSAIIVSLLLSTLKKTPYPIAVILKITGLSSLAIYIIDIAILINFNTHLVINDILKYATYSQKYLYQIYGYLAIIVELIIALLLIAAILTKKSIKNNPLSTTSILILSILPSTWFFKNNEQYVHAWVYRDVINYNLMISSEASPYSKKLIDNIEVTDTLECFKKPSDKKNIILLMVESLSSVHSQFFSGLNNWTPTIDNIARQNKAYTQFFANGFTTEDGEIALLTGIPPIYPPSTYNNDGGTSFYSFYGIQDSLPRLLKRHGYASDFLTTADLEFANTEAWAKSIGFEYIEGHKHPFYNRWPRFHFEAAPDAALYQRVLDRIHQHGHSNFLIFIKTVSSHHPYVNPENGHQSAAEVFQYVDRQIGIFYQKLLDKHFFDNGILVIVGDHHAMTPLTKNEVDLFGQYQASARIPMIIASGGHNQSIDDRHFQQLDIFNSLSNLPNIQTCHSDWIGNLLSNNDQPARYILHRRGDNRDIVSIFTDKDNYSVKLDGDNTRLSQPSLSEPDIAKRLVDRVNTLRIRRQQALATGKD